MKSSLVFGWGQVEKTAQSWDPRAEIEEIQPRLWLVRVGAVVIGAIGKEPWTREAIAREAERHDLGVVAPPSLTCVIIDVQAEAEVPCTRPATWTDGGEFHTCAECRAAIVKECGEGEVRELRPLSEPTGAKPPGARFPRARWSNRRVTT